MTALPEKTILERSDIEHIRPNLDMLKIINSSAAERAQTFPFGREGKYIGILTTNSSPSLVQQMTDRIAEKGWKTKMFYTDEESFSYALSRYEQLKSLQERTRAELEERTSAKGTLAEEMIVELYHRKEEFAENEFIMEIVRLGYKSGASDIHFQAEEAGYVMRLRKDGILKKILLFEHQEFRKYFIKLKYIAGVRLNIDYVPQDGRFSFFVAKQNSKAKIDVRVNFMPSLRGESVVMRYLDSTKGIMSLSAIGFQGRDLDNIQESISHNFGLILVTGPTGSGKTTTLYSMLDKLNEPGKKIITLENPVEYELPGIQQSQINTTKGYTYAQGLKAILRQDPDIIMVGEIRDLETAEIAVNAALTGHLVLSTLHTNSAIEAINRLLNIGVPPFMLAPAVQIIIGQRLVRRLNQDYSMQDASFAEEEEIKDAIKKMNDARYGSGFASQDGISGLLTFDGRVPIARPDVKGINDGYEGRIAVVETLQITKEIEHAMMQEKSTLDIYSIARSQGFTTLKEDGYHKLLQNVTTLEEIRRVL